MRLASLALAALASVAFASPASAQWQLTTYRVTANNTPDFNGIPDGANSGCCSGLKTGWVQAALSAGRPVLSAAGDAYAGTNAIISVAAGQNIPWWTVGGMGGAVALDASGLYGGPGASFNTGASWFATGQANNSTIQRSAWFSGVATNSGSSIWSVEGDDDAWVFRNGQLVLDNGGVKAIGNASSGVTNWLAGDQVDIFVADRNTVGSQLIFSANGLNVSTVPEPSTYVLMAFGLAGLGAAARRRRAV